MNEWKWNNRQSLNKIHKVFGCYGSRWKNMLKVPTTKTNNGCFSNFQYTKFSVIDLVLTDKRNLSGKWPKSACGKSVDFCSQSWEIHYQSHSLHNFWFFFLYFGFLPLLEKFARGFFSVLEAIIQKNCNKQPRIENGEGFAIHLSTWLSGTKGKDVSAADWLYQTHVKKYCIFFMWVVSAFLRAGNPWIAP